MASSGQIKGWPDPATDHSSTSDNGVAGIVIGGNYNNTPHPAEYLVSPVINLSAATGATLYLSFWRWLNCDNSKWLHATVDVSGDNGTTWTNLYLNPSGGTQSPSNIEDAWTRQQYDISTFKGSQQFLVRIGQQTFQAGGADAWIMSGWNIDDLTISSAACN
jgi:hypothetical protein